MARSATDLGLALDILIGPNAAQAIAWRLELPAPRGDSLRGYRIAAWLDDVYCPIDSEVLRVLASVVDAVAAAGATVDATAWPCPLRTAERLAQQLIQAEFAGAYPEPECERLQDVAATADSADDSAPVRHARNVTARARELGVAREASARLSARCAAFFLD